MNFAKYTEQERIATSFSINLYIIEIACMRIAYRSQLIIVLVI